MDIRLSGPILKPIKLTPRINLRDDRNEQNAKDLIMDVMIEKHDWDSLSMNEKMQAPPGNSSYFQHNSLWVQEARCDTKT